MFYKFLIKMMKFITAVFRLIQALALLYLVLYIIFWLMVVFQAKSVPHVAQYFSYFNPVTDFIFEKCPALASSEFSIFQVYTIVSILIYVVILVLYNFIFVFLGSIEEKIITRGYKVGALKDTEIPYYKM